MNYFSRKNVLSIIAIISLSPLANAMDGTTTTKNKLEEIIDKLVAHSALLMHHYGPNPEANYLLNIAASNGNQAAINYFGTVNAESKLHVQRHRILQGNQAFTELCQRMRFNALETDTDFVAYRWFSTIIDDEFTPGAETEQIIGDAAFMLGSLCQMKRGVPQKLANKESAQNFFEIAAQHGNKLAQEKLAEFGVQWQAPEPIKLIKTPTETLPIAPATPTLQTLVENESLQNPQPVTPSIPATPSPLREETLPQPTPAPEQSSNTTPYIIAKLYIKQEVKTDNQPSNAVQSQTTVEPSSSTPDQPTVPVKTLRPERAIIEQAEKGNLAETIITNIEKQEPCGATKDIIQTNLKKKNKKSHNKAKKPAKKLKRQENIEEIQVEIEKKDRIALTKKERDDAFELLSALLTHFTHSAACNTTAASLKQTYKQYSTALDLYNYTYSKLQEKNVRLPELEGTLLCLQGKFAAAREKLSNIPICFDLNIVNWYLAHAIFYDTAQSPEPSTEVIKQIVAALESALCMPIKKSQEYAKFLKLDKNMIKFLQDHSYLDKESDSTILTILARIGTIFGDEVIGHEKNSISIILEELTDTTHAYGTLCLAEMYLYGIGAEKSITRAIEKLQEAIYAPIKTADTNTLIEQTLNAATDMSAKNGELAQLKIPYLLLIHNIKTKNPTTNEIIERFKKTELMADNVAKKGVNLHNLIKETGLYDILLALAKNSPAIASSLANAMSLRIISNALTYKEYAEALDIAVGHFKQHSPKDNPTESSAVYQMLFNIASAKRAAGLSAEALELFDHISHFFDESSKEFKRILFEIAITHCTSKEPNFALGTCYLAKLAENEETRSHYLFDDEKISDEQLFKDCEQDIKSIQEASHYHLGAQELLRSQLAKSINDNLFYFARSMIGYTGKQKTSKQYSIQFYGLLKKARELNNQNASHIIETIKSFMKS